MKRGFLLIICGFLVVLSCKKDTTTPPPEKIPPASSDVNLRSGLLVYLPFDGSMADSSGNGNPVTGLTGAALTYDEHGNPNSAFEGNGSGARILVTNNGSIKIDTAYTVSVDLMNRTNGRYTILDMVDNTNAESYCFGVGSVQSSPYTIDYNVSNHLATCNSNPLISNLFADTTSFVPEPESWYNIIVIFHKGTLSSYVNGKLIATRSGGDSTVTICPSAKVLIGGWWDGDPASIDGKLDEVRLYNRVLNADEIAALSKEFQ